MKSIRTLLGALPLLALAHTANADGNTAPVVFVCEHGVAKSVIAATLFNQMAEARGLAVRAEARGIQIEPALQAATREGLSRDGFDVSQITPKSLQADDVQRAAAVITIGVANEPAFISKEKLQEWDDVPAVSKDYPAARDVMRAHIETLLTTLSTKK